MTIQRRHGLRALTIRTDTHTAGTEQIRTGRRTVVVTPLAVYGPDGHERPGDRLMLLDETGRPVAVVRIIDVAVATLGSVSEADRRADDPDCPGRKAWTDERRREWTTSGGRRGDDVPVVCVRFRVVGLDEPDATTSQG